MIAARKRRQGTAPSGASGLTLVEVLVVMFILALLAQTAVLATEGLAAQTMRDVTERSLSDMEVALLGHDGRVDAQGRAAVTGFVADVGRLPRARIGTEPAAALRELWERRDAEPVPPSERIPTLRIGSPPGDSEVQLACGWRGPYLRLGFGRSVPLDGWGRRFELWTELGVAVAEGDLVAGMESFGADGSDDPPGVVSPGYDADLGLTVEREVAPLVQARHLGTVRVQVRNLAAAQRTFLVRLYGPRDGVPATLAQPLSVTVAATSDAEVSLPSIPIGPRVVRVYEVVAGGDPAPEDPVPEGPRSRVWYVAVEAGVGSPLIVEMH